MINAEAEDGGGVLLNADANLLINAEDGGGDGVKKTTTVL